MLMVYHMTPRTHGQRSGDAMSYKHGILMDDELGIPENIEDLPEYQFREWAANIQAHERRGAKITFPCWDIGMVTMTWVELDALIAQGREAFERWVEGGAGTTH